LRWEFARGVFAAMVVLVSFRWASASTEVHAPQPESLRTAILRDLGEFKSGEWTQREKAFWELVGLASPGGYKGESWKTSSAMIGLFHRVPDLEDQIRVGLIRLLDVEDGTVRLASAGSLSEEYMNYWGDLVGAVEGLHDRRAIAVLLDNLRLGGGAVQGVAAFGVDVLDRVLTLLDGDDTSRTIGTTTLAAMVNLNPTPLDARGKARVKTALVRAAADSYFPVRLAAINGLARLPGDDVTLLLRAIATNDLFFQPPPPGQLPIYPVRRAAEEALRGRVGRGSVGLFVRKSMMLPWHPQLALCSASCFGESMSTTASNSPAIRNSAAARSRRQPDYRSRRSNQVCP
jgi:hypothetical protein